MPKQTLSALDRRIAQHDREIAAIRQLIKTGMKLLNEVQKSQKKTEHTLERFIRSLGHGPTNGHKKGHRIQ